MTAASTTTLPPSVETLREQLDDAAKHIGLQRERIKALEAALRPFAEIAEHDIGDGEADHDLYHIISAKNAHAPLPRVGHFRRALSVLSGEAK